VRDQLTRRQNSDPKNLPQNPTKTKSKGKNIASTSHTQSTSATPDIIAAFPELNKEQKKEMNKLLNLMEEALQQEENTNTPSLFPPHSIDHILLAFFVMSYDTADDLAALLQHMSFAVDFEKLTNRDKTPWTVDSLNAAFATDAAAASSSVKANSQSLDRVFISQNINFLTGVFPYKEKQPPISNGNCYYVQASEDFAQSTTFADCVETSLRHIVNLITFDPINRRFNIPEHLKNTPLASFYESQTPELANGGETDLRSLWNKAAARQKNVVYNNKLPGEESESNNMTSGFVNILRALKSITQQAFTTEFSENASLDQKRQWIIKELEAVFKSLNPTHTYYSHSN
jgi:hypothetical protein